MIGLLVGPFAAGSPSGAGAAADSTEPTADALITGWDWFPQRSAAAFDLNQAFEPQAGFEAYVDQGPSAEQPRPPRFEPYQDATPTCDLNGDGFNDMVVQEGRYTPTSPPVLVWDAKGRSGTNGTELWNQYNARALIGNPGALWSYPPPFRPGIPPPYGIAPHPDSLRLSPDVTGDGVCDVLLVGADGGDGIGDFGVALIGGGSWDFHIRMVNGANGSTVWERKFHGDWTFEAECVPNPANPFRCMVPYDLKSILKNFLTGATFFVSPTGPKVAFKLTHMNSNSPTAFGPTEAQVLENITLLDGFTGKDYWSRYLAYAQPVTTWLTGASDLGGDPEFEIVLDDIKYVTNLQDVSLNAFAFPGELVKPVTEVLPYFWGPTDFKAQPREGQVPSLEEDRERLAFTFVRLIGDLDDDGRQEVAASYLTNVLLNGEDGGIRTHFAPISGAKGRLVWPDQDIKIQGWGFYSDLNPDPSSSRPFIGFGTADFFRPASAFGASMPHQRYRVGVFDIPKSTLVWTRQYEFPYDSPLSRDLALYQIMEVLAPMDHDDDGLRDLVTPAQYYPPSGATQTLLSTIRQNYEILGGREGTTLLNFTAWGPNGRIVPCEGQPAKSLTVTSGFSWRVDASRLDTELRVVDWRKPLHNLPRGFRTITDGQTVTFIGSRCGDMPDNRTMLGVNIGERIIRQGKGIFPVQAYFSDNASRSYISRQLIGNVRTPSIFDVFPPQPEPPSQLASLGVSVAPIIPGAALAWAMAWRSVRRARRRGKEDP